MSQTARSYSGWIKGFSTDAIESFIRNEAANCGLALSINITKGGLLSRGTIQFRVQGHDWRGLHQFNRNVRQYCKSNPFVSTSVDVIDLFSV